jgi:hypothetical protein
MSYDQNGHNSRQDILEEIERLERLRSTKPTKESILDNPRALQRPSKHGRQERRTKREM